MTRVLGVDPGLRGALAVVDMAERRLVAHRRIPIVIVTRRLALVDPAALLPWLAEQRPARAVLERTAPRWPNALGAVDTAARLWGALAALLRVYAIPLDVVEPAAWKEAAGLANQPKRAAIGAADARLAGAAALKDPATGSLEYRIAVAEAALIALHGVGLPSTDRRTRA